MRDRRDRTTWAYQIPQNSNPLATYQETINASTCPPQSSAQIFPALNSQALLTPSRNQQQQHQFLTTSPHPVASITNLQGIPYGYSDRSSSQQQQQEAFQRQLAPLPPSFTMMTETWFGLVQTPRDAYLLLEACRLGLLYRITRRLTDLERSQIIRPGAVFVWEEKEAGIKRWTDHVRWSPSRVSGAFLIYSELLSASSRDNHPHASDPLLKQSFSSTTVDGDRLHLIAYYSKAALDSGQLPTPSADDRLRSIVIPPGIYPDHRATGGVEDQTSRDRQRVNLIPRSPATSFKTFDSSPSSNSLKANIPLLDASHLQATNAAVLSETTTEARTSLDTVGNSASPKGVLYHKKAVESRYPATSGYLGGTLYSVDSGYIPKQTLIADNHKWGKLQQNISDWCTNGKALQSFPDSGSRTSTPCTAPSVNNAPSVQTLPPLGSWQSIEERERLNERRFSAPAKQDGAESRSSTSTTSHGFHPYCRSSDRDSEGKERRVENKGLRDSRGLSYEPSTAPGTPVTRAYTLPSI
ncbi:Gti1/Pac2 family-domain-containing protein, partial [Phakopsora pachyrhizi]